MIRKTLVFLALLLPLTCSNTYAQEESTSSIRLGIAPGVSMNNSTDGMGLFYSVGFQRELKNDRLRLHPYFSLGHYSNKFITDSRDLYFNSLSISTNLYYDILKAPTASLFIGGGIVMNNTRGLLGTGGDMEGNNSSTSSDFVSTYHIGACALLGFRFTNSKKKTTLNIIPLNIRYGSEGYSEILFTLEWEIKY